MTNMNERKLYFKYAEIEVDTGECVGIRTQTYPIDHPALIPIEVGSDEYMGKYYLNGAWYEDAEGNIPWTEPTA